MTSDRLSGFVFLGIGLWACQAAFDMSLGTLQSPGPGLYPLLLGALLALLGAVLLMSSLRAGGERNASAAVGRMSPHTSAVAAAVVALLAYTAVLHVAGFALATVVLLIVLFRLGRMGWSGAALLSLALTAASLAAASWMNIPLPVGALLSEG